MKRMRSLVRDGTGAVAALLSMAAMLSSTVPVDAALSRGETPGSDALPTARVATSTMDPTPASPIRIENRLARLRRKHRSRSRRGRGDLLLPSPMYVSYAPTIAEDRPTPIELCRDR